MAARRAARYALVEVIDLSRPGDGERDAARPAELDALSGRPAMTGGNGQVYPGPGRHGSSR